MNLYTKRKKKMKGKKTKALKKKIITAGEIFAAGALLTAGGNMVDNLSEDSSPQISASEVNWIQDQGKALFEIKTFQRDSGFTAWGARRYIMLALGMILLAIPTIKFIHWIRKSCRGRSGTHTTDEEESEDNREPVVIHNSVQYSPSSEDTVRTAYDSKPTTSMAKLQDQLEHEIQIQSRDSRKCE